MVVFVGESYFRRMWCMLELFTYVRSGGTVGRIKLKPLHAEKAESVIATLDIGKADCYLREDKQRILAIVESSYGSSSQFNAVCRRILKSVNDPSEGNAASDGESATSTKGGRKYRVRVAPDEA